MNSVGQLPFRKERVIVKEGGGGLLELEAGHYGINAGKSVDRRR